MNRSTVRFLAAALLVVPLQALASSYSVTDLGFGYGWDINQDGEAVGSLSLGGYPGIHAVSWDASGVMTDLGTLGGIHSAAYAVNDSGQIVGHSAVTGSLDVHAFLSYGGTMTDLGTLGGNVSYALDINSSGQVVGEAETRPGNTARHAFVTVSGVMTDIGTLGGSSSSAYAINDSGQMVGLASTYLDIQRHAFLFANGTMTDLGTLGGTESAAYDINEHGDVVGFAMTNANLEQYATLWRNGAMTNLGALPGGTHSVANSINNAGQIVGSSHTSGDTRSHATLWKDGMIIDLNSIAGTLGAGWTLTEALAINDAGQILVQGNNYSEDYSNGSEHAFLLTQVPAPAAVWLFSSALAALGVRQRKQHA